MGCCSSSTTQQTTIPPPTPEEQALMQMTTDGLMTAYLSESGFDVKKNTTSWDQSAEGQRLLDQQSQLQQQIKTAQQAPQNPQGNKGNGGQNQANQVQQLQNQLNSLNAKITDAQTKYQPATTYDVRQKESPEAEAIRTQYGVDSPEYKAAHEKYTQNKIDTQNEKDSIDKQILDNTQKFLNGDFALNDGQKKFMDDVLGPMKQAGLNAIDYLKTESDKSEKSIGKTIDDFTAQVKQTGLDVGDAIGVLEDRVQKTGANMKTALNDEVEFTKKLNEMGLQDFTTEQRKSLASQAASLGRSPTDPEFVQEMQTRVDRQISETNLALGQYAADKSIGIESQTGQGMESAAQLRIQNAQQTGQGLASADTAKMGLAERMAGIREGIANQQGQQEVGLAATEGNLRSNLATGLPPSQIATGINVGQYNNAIQQQQLANMGAAMNAPLNIYNTMSKERFGQPTVTSTSTPSVASLISGVIGTGLSGLATAGSMGFKPFA